MVLHGEPDAENGEHPGCERVDLQHDGVQVAPESHGHQFCSTEVLGGPGEGRVVLMVGGVHPLVKAGVLVVHEVPDEVLGVKDEQGAKAATKDLPESGRHRGQKRWRH